MEKKHYATLKNSHLRQVYTVNQLYGCFFQQNGLIYSVMISWNKSDPRNTCVTCWEKYELAFRDRDRKENCEYWGQQCEYWGQQINMVSQKMEPINWISFFMKLRKRGLFSFLFRRTYRQQRSNSFVLFAYSRCQTQDLMVLRARFLGLT